MRVWIAIVVAMATLGCEGIIDDKPPIEPPTLPPSDDTPPPPFEAVTPALPRLTAAQYRASLVSIFGEVPAVELEPDTNPDLFYNIGASSTTLSDRGASLYEEAAHEISEAILSSERRAATLGCEVEDASCREAFIERIGRRLFRRPLTSEESARWYGVSEELADGQPLRGIRFALAGMLQSPLFLYRPEIGTPAGEERALTDFEYAAKLSFLFWNEAPDEALLDAAASGALSTAEGRREQALRLLDDPRAERAVQAFFAQYFDLGRLSRLDLDPALYPAFSSTLGSSMRTEVELRVQDIVFRRKADMRELFFSRASFVNAELASLYGVEAEGADAITFVPVELPEERPGILTTGAFLAMNAHPTETSPTLRGKYIRERVLCQTVRAAPNDVNTDIPPIDMSAPRTLRERLEAHRDDPACRNCHEFMDPPGFLFEHFDSIGSWRDREPGGEIDATGSLDGTDLDGATDLGTVLREDPRVPACVVKQLYRHTMGRLEADTERAALASLEASFRSAGYRFDELMLAFALSDEFRTIGGEE